MLCILCTDKYLIHASYYNILRVGVWCPAHLVCSSTLCPTVSDDARSSILNALSIALNDFYSLFFFFERETQNLIRKTFFLFRRH